MFIKAISKQRFGEVQEPFINIDQIVSAHAGHEDNVNVKLSNGEEFTVCGERAALLLAWLEQNQLG
jgi:hypothetical protein